MMEPVIRVENLTKIYGNRAKEALRLLEAGTDSDEIFAKTGAIAAVRDVSFSVEPGELLVVIGLSGSGKSTLIRTLNGLISPTVGNVYFYQRRINGLTKKELREFRRSSVSMVFQDFCLMNHRNVLENVAFGLEIRGVRKEEREEKARQYISLVGLDGAEHADIESLSGGMLQRVGLARALANEPDILLMDEPFSAIDPIVRAGLQRELLSIHKRLKKSIIFITHDINEAFRLGQRIAIMQNGELIQIETPEQMLFAPKTDYVREFIGSADKTLILCAGNLMHRTSQTVTGDNCHLVDEQTSLRELVCIALQDNAPIFVMEDGVSKGIVPRERILTAFTT